MLTRRGFIEGSASAGTAGVLAFAASVSSAQTIHKNVRVLVGFPAGGSIDVAARILVEHLKDYAPSIIVDNRPGAGGRLVLDALKASEADGAVIVITPGDQITLFPHIYQALGYNPLKDFSPVTTVCTFPFLLTVGPMVPASIKTLTQFADWCRENPKLATYGSPGAGTRPHFIGVTFARAAAVEFIHLPYKGGAAALQDLLAGQIPAAISVVSNALPHIQSGSLRALVTTAPQRSALLPDVPTAREAGYANMEALEWFGLFVPAQTPNETIKSLNRAVQTALQNAAVKAAFARQSFDVAGVSGDEFTMLIRADTQRWGETVRASGFKPIE
jgi:tripartite-type tricarboxylate transporter receptor subunit TctC